MSILDILVIVGYILRLKNIKKFIVNSTDLTWLVISEINFLFLVVLALAYRYIKLEFFVPILLIITSFGILSLKLKLKSYIYTDEKDCNWDKNIVSKLIIGLVLLVIIVIFSNVQYFSYIFRDTKF